MPIPNFNISGILPPYLLGSSPAVQSDVSPYKSTLVDFVNFFNTSPPRKNLLEGFLKHRIELKKLGIVDGFQWIDGSFVEEVEKIRSKDPSDVDLITFAYRPPGIPNDLEWQKIINSNLAIFHPQFSKKHFNCDAYYIDLNLKSDYIARQTSYWFGLFTHQKITDAWKGIVEINLIDDESVILHQLQGS
ncbi:DUF6932 family protein [Leptospira idonii]|uniref:Uncharacterized protein n=1 Tax=Leptospira idonii TaxID=1193500 RepID=A0A4R9M267_9LEPT|nr:hypothetical protein [Leptospira idonii]TGN18858.1 hypothetical protein EHS15_11835 [Leptospira idonii]